MINCFHRGNPAAKRYSKRAKGKMKRTETFQDLGNEGYLASIVALRSSILNASPIVIELGDPRQQYD